MNDDTLTADERQLIADWIDVPVDKVEAVEFFVEMKRAGCAEHTPPLQPT